jgi:hypothetical protein
VSHSSNSNGGSQTDVGLKASYTTPAVQNTTTTFSFKFGATVDKQKDKR